MLPHAWAGEYSFLLVAWAGMVFAMYRFLQILSVYYTTQQSLHDGINNETVPTLGPVPVPVGAVKPEELEAVIMSDIRQEFFLGIVHAMITVTATAFIFLDPPPPEPSAQAKFSIVMWMTVSLLLSVKSWVLWYSRKQEEAVYDDDHHPARRRADKSHD